MYTVIDTPWNTTAHLDALKAQGVKTIIRYFNHRNSNRLPEKRVEAAEAAAIAEAGMSLCTVFQQRGGSGGNIQDLDAQSGKSDAARALKLAKRIQQPEGSAIYFAVDHDYFRSSDLASIAAYFEAINNALAGKYRVGVYGSGTVGKTVTSKGFAELIWLAAATGWSGTRDMLETSDWALYQKWPPIAAPLAHDGNVVSPAWPDYGQFVSGTGGSAIEQGRTANVVLMEVTARGGLNVRRGPGTNYAVEQALPKDTIVHALAHIGEWVQVDVNGDGRADGHVHGNYLRTISGGFPMVSLLSMPFTPPTPGTVPTSGTPTTPHTPSTSGTPLMAVLPILGSSQSPYNIALAELALDVREVAGDGNNPRIVMYHNSTGASVDNRDAVAWCSSFVNYCVEQAGMEGTDSQWALTWKNWGQKVSAQDVREGDIAVFERVGKGGHVGFVIEDLPDHVKVLGGNQKNRVKVSTYPKDGLSGSTHYKLKAYRRA